MFLDSRLELLVLLVMSLFPNSYVANVVSVVSVASIASLAIFSSVDRVDMTTKVLPTLEGFTVLIGKLGFAVFLGC